VSTVRLAGILFIAMIFLGAGAATLGYLNTIYPLDRANALMSRAQTTGFADQMISYVEEARMLLPKEGNPVWILPTKRTDFGLIQADLQSILDRAQILRRMDRASDAYQQGMDDLKDKLAVVESQVRDAAPFLFASSQNTLLGVVWLLAESFLVIYLIRASRRRPSVESGGEGDSAEDLMADGP